MTVRRIVSGGQTGADRAALDVASELGILSGGWCPAGRAAEDGPIGPGYPLTETASADPAERTRLNVRDADATLIIASGALTGGTALARRVADELGRPCRVADPDDPRAPQAIAAWLRDHAVETLNVAGPRESGQPGIYERAARLLRSALREQTRREDD